MATYNTIKVPSVAWQDADKTYQSSEDMWYEMTAFSATGKSGTPSLDVFVDGVATVFGGEAIRGNTEETGILSQEDFKESLKEYLEKAKGILFSTSERDYHVYMYKYLFSEAPIQVSRIKHPQIPGFLSFTLPKTVHIPCTPGSRYQVSSATRGGTEIESDAGNNPSFWNRAAKSRGYVFRDSIFSVDWGRLGSAFVTGTETFPSSSPVFYAGFPTYIANNDGAVPTALSNKDVIVVPSDYINTEETATNRQEIDAKAITAAMKSFAKGEKAKPLEKTIPLSEQAILLYRLPSLAKSNRERRKKGMNYEDVNPGTWAHVNPEPLYDRFAAVDAKNKKEMDTLVNSLTSPPLLNALFDKVKPRHLSACIPRLRLFKLYLPQDPRIKDKVVNTDNSRRIAVEYELDEYIRSEMNTTAGATKKDILGNTLTTNTGVGVESFNWDFNGTNEFEAERLVTANLKLRAQSIQALEEPKMSSKSAMPYRFSDLFIPEELPADSPDSVPGTPEDKKDQYQTTTIKQFESRVLVEYGVDEGNPVFNETADGKEVAQALKKLRLAINLVINSYTIDLRDDGSVGVNISFTGRLEAHAKDPTFGSILPAFNAGSALARKRGRLAGRYKDLAAVVTKSEEEIRFKQDTRLRELLTHFETHDITPETATGENKAEYDKVMSEISALQERIRVAKEMRGEDKGVDNFEDFFAMVQADASRLELYRTVYDKLIKRKALKVLTVDPRNVVPGASRTAPPPCVEPEHADSIDQERAALATEGKMAIKNANSAEWIEGAKKEFQNRLTAITMPAYTTTHYRIPFIYFGDLLDAVLDNVYESRNPEREAGQSLASSAAETTASTTESDIRTILGPISFKRNAFQAAGFDTNIRISNTGKISVSDEMGTTIEVQTIESQQKAKQGAENLQNEKSTDTPAAIPVDHQEVLANLADVPISFNLFLQWWAERVSNTGKLSYSLKAFLSDAVQSLIVASLEARSSRVLLPQQNVKYITTTWDSPTRVGQPDSLGFVQSPTGDLKVSPPTRGIQYQETAIEDKSPTAPENQSSFSTNTHQVTKFDLLNIEDLKAAKNKLPMGEPNMSGGGYESDYLLVCVQSSDWHRKYQPGKLWGESGIFEYERDVRDGVYHLESGKDSGMVRSISMSAYPSEGYEEMQIMNALKGGKRPVRRIYQATVELQGITFFRPGQTVYINAAAYGEFKTLLKYGLCGYYTVRTVSSRISSGEFVTELQCDFRASGEHPPPKPEGE